jgi:phage baseplate assembly protein W
VDADKRFLGTGWGFPPSFARFGGGLRVRMVSEEEDIRESLHILLSTAPGERVMQPDYGCGLRRLVFAHLNDSTLTEIRDVIGQAVLFHEVRITLNAVDADAGEWAEGLLKLRLDYTVRSTNTRTNMVYPFYFLHAA